MRVMAGAAADRRAAPAGENDRRDIAHEVIRNLRVDRVAVGGRRGPSAARPPACFLSVSR